MNNMGKSIKWQLTIPITIIVSVIQIVVIFTVFTGARSIIIKYARENAMSEIKYFAEKIDGSLKMNAHNTENLALCVQHIYDEANHDKVGEMVFIWGKYRNNTEGVWFVGDSHYRNQGYYPCWYVNRKGKVTWWKRTNYDQDKGIAQLTIYSVQNGKISSIDSTYDQFDYTDLKYADDPRFDFYHGARKRSGTYFSIPMHTPWVDYNVLTVSTPVYNEQKELIGVVGTDMDTSDIQEIAANITLIPHFGNALLPRLKEATSKSVQLVLWVFTLVSLRGLSEVNILG